MDLVVVITRELGTTTYTTEVHCCSASRSVFRGVLRDTRLVVSLLLTPRVLCSLLSWCYVV